MFIAAWLRGVMRLERLWVLGPKSGLGFKAKPHGLCLFSSVKMASRIKNKEGIDAS